MLYENFKLNHKKNINKDESIIFACWVDGKKLQPIENMIMF